MQYGGTVSIEFYEGIGGIIIGILLIVVAYFFTSGSVAVIIGILGGIMLFLASASTYLKYQKSQLMDASNLVGNAQKETSLIL